MTETVASRLAGVHERVAAAAARAGRRAESVTLVAVGKAQPVELLQEAYEAGHRDFGENRAQELAAKQPLLPPDVRWHFVGPLQRNKVRRVRPVAALLHSLDRASLASEWAKGAAAPPVLLEINLAAEAQKAGVPPEGAPELAALVVDLGIEVRGLMAIPPFVRGPEDARPFFAELAALRDSIASRFPAVTELSMGMTADYHVAIEEGATLVRVGRAIFGPRPGR